MIWTISKAKQDFQRGLLVGVLLERKPGGWLIYLDSLLQFDGSGYLVDVRSHEPRLFSTVDAALKAAESIGFVFSAVRLEVQKDVSYIFEQC